MKLASKFKYMFDAAPESALVTKDHVAKTATFNGNAVALPAVGGYWNVPAVAADSVLAIAVNVEALDAGTGDETYTLTLEFGTDDTFGTATTTHTLVVTETGQYALLVDIDTVAALLGAAPGAVRLVGTLAGTTPSITLHAWLAGDIKGC